PRADEARRLCIDNMERDAGAHPGGHGHAGAPSLVPVPAAAGGRVLIVDDQEANLALLARVLTRDGHVVLQARSGAEALELVEREQPDVVLLDVMMPHMSGFDVCQAIKAHSSTRLTPVVLVTALQDTRDRINGIEAGAADFLTKPINPPELRARVRSL